MSTIIWYHKKRHDYCVLVTPDLKWSGVTRAECVAPNSLGITSDDLDRAEASPDTWIVCEEKTQPPAESEVTT